MLPHTLLGFQILYDNWSHFWRSLKSWESCWLLPNLKNILVKVDHFHKYQKGQKKQKNTFETNSLDEVCHVSSQFLGHGEFLPVPQNAPLRKTWTHTPPASLLHDTFLKTNVDPKKHDFEKEFPFNDGDFEYHFWFWGNHMDQQRDTFLKNFYELVPRIHLHPSSWRMHPEKMSESKAFVFFCWTLNILGRLIWELPMILFLGELLAGQKCCLYGGELPMVLAPFAGFEAFVLQKKISNRHSSHTKTVINGWPIKNNITFEKFRHFFSPPKTPGLFHPEKQPELKKT